MATPCRSSSGDLIAVIFVTAIQRLVQHHRHRGRRPSGSQSGARTECHRHRQHADRRVFGGYPGCISVSRSDAQLPTAAADRPPVRPDRCRHFGADAGGGADALLGYMPKFVLGGLLDLSRRRITLHKWIVQSRRRLSLTEYLSLLAIIAIILQWGFVSGILIGTVIGCATFAFSASRIESIKYSFDGSEYRSSLDRSRDDQAVLDSPWRQDPGPEPAELSVLRLGQPTVPARQDPARASPRMPILGVRFQAGHRHRFLGRL